MPANQDEILVLYAVALVYIERLEACGKMTFNNVQIVFLTTLNLAFKFVMDYNVSNKEFISYFGRSVCTLNRMERYALQELDYNLCVSVRDFKGMLNWIYND